MRGKEIRIIGTGIGMGNVTDRGRGIGIGIGVMKEIEIGTEAGEMVEGIETGIEIETRKTRVEKRIGMFHFRSTTGTSN